MTRSLHESAKLPAVGDHGDRDGDRGGDRGGVTSARAARVAAADARFHKLLTSALEADPATTAGLAVVAVGGYGRGELSTVSDLDVVLVHDDWDDVRSVASALWYPLWDDGVRLDHSVRTVADALDAARGDVRTAMSLLDARHVAGDAALTLRLRTHVRAAWRYAAPTRLPELAASCRARAQRIGELAHLLEPDLKEAYGGLREVATLRAVAASWLVDVPLRAVDQVATTLLDVRDVLHAVSPHRRGDRLLAELQPEVAEQLGFDDRDHLLAHVYRAGRRLAHLADLTWRRTGHALGRTRGHRRQAVRSRIGDHSGRDGQDGQNRPSEPSQPRQRSVMRVRRGARATYGPVLESLAPGVALADGEVVLESGAQPQVDPEIAVRAAFAAAERGVILSPVTATRLAREIGSPVEPWSEDARRCFAGLLGSGPNLPAVWESLDQAGLTEVWLPEWAGVRCLPQHSPLHRHTVDRHLIETCVHASELAQWVRRPDLLLWAALLHDIDKSRGKAHAEAGATTAERMMRRLGYSDGDAAFVAHLVCHHLTLIQTATRRDLDDPNTITHLASVLGSVETLDALQALTEADARATGSAAWTRWRARLVDTLSARVRERLEQGRLPEAEPPQT